jgi:hypothetical protein
MTGTNWRHGRTSRSQLRCARPWLEILEARVVPSFIEAPSVAAGLFPVAVATGDFNGDGTPDVVVANNINNGTVSVLLGNRDGSFQAPISSAAGPYPQSVAVGDFNGDGILDLAVVNNINDGTVSVLRGNGDGTFQAPQPYAVGLRPYAVAVGDFNGDGIPDLVVTNRNTANVSVLLGKGDGTFEAAQNYATQPGPSGVVVGDVNGDGIQDLAVADYGLSSSGHTVNVLLGNGDGTFQAHQDYDAGTHPLAVAVGDFAGDGLLDLAVSDSNDAGVVQVLRGNGDGSFQAPQGYPVASYPAAVTASDFFGDGTLDLAVANIGAARSACYGATGTAPSRRLRAMPSVRDPMAWRWPTPSAALPTWSSPMITRIPSRCCATRGTALFTPPLATPPAPPPRRWWWPT